MWRAPNCEQVMTGDNTFLTIWEFLSHEEYLRRNKIGLSLLSREGSTTQLGGKKEELEFQILFLLVFFVWPIGQISHYSFGSPTSRQAIAIDRIAIRLPNFYTHPPLPEVWLTPELREPFKTYSFLVPHSLTLPEYLAQFVCKLDYYSLMFYYA